MFDLKITAKMSRKVEHPSDNNRDLRKRKMRKKRHKKKGKEEKKNPYLELSMQRFCCRAAVTSDSSLILPSMILVSSLITWRCGLA